MAQAAELRSSTPPNIQDVFLNYARREKMSVSIHLMDGRQFDARIKNFDRFAVIVEVDGGQHAESVQVRARDRYFATKEWRVLRFWNNDVLRNLPGVLEAIRMALSAPPHPGPPMGEGEDEKPPHS